MRLSNSNYLMLILFVAAGFFVFKAVENKNETEPSILYVNVELLTNRLNSYDYPLTRDNVVEALLEEQTVLPIEIQDDLEARIKKLELQK